MLLDMDEKAFANVAGVEAGVGVGLVWTLVGMVVVCCVGRALGVVCALHSVVG